jgi:hypothetical protein
MFCLKERSSWSQLPGLEERSHSTFDPKKKLKLCKSLAHLILLYVNEIWIVRLDKSNFGFGYGILVTNSSSLQQKK